MRWPMRAAIGESIEAADRALQFDPRDTKHAPIPAASTS